MIARPSSLARRAPALSLAAIASALGLAGCPEAPLAPPPEERLAELAGRDAEAWEGFLARAEAGPGPASEAALVHLLGLVDRVALGPRDLARARPFPELLEEVAARLGDAAALADARARLGAVYAARVDDGPAVPIRAGFIAAPDAPGPHVVRVEPAFAGPAEVELRGDASVVVRVGERVVVARDRRAAYLPIVARVEVDLDAARPLTLTFADPGARLRVLVRPRPPTASSAAAAPAAPAATLDALDRAIAALDLAAATALAADLERRGAWGPLAHDAERRFASVDPTRPPESVEPVERPIPDAAIATSCAARARRIGDDGEALRYRPAEVARLADGLPLLVGPCVAAALQAGELLVDTFQLDAADRLAARVDAALDPGPETARAAALRARVARARGEPGASAPPAPRRLELGLPLDDVRARVAAAELGPGETVLWDDRFVHVRKDGQTVRSHVVACAGDEAATESLGELELPDDAEVILARTWRRDADPSVPPRALEPEDIAEKATISLPALLPGDCAEWAWFREVPADPRLPPGGFVLEPFALQRDAARVAAARFTLRADPGIAPSFSVDARLHAAPPVDGPADSTGRAARTWVFTASDLDPLVAEPLDPRPALRLAHVTAWSGFDLEAWRAAEAALVAPGLRPSPVLARLAARTPATETARDRVLALHAAVVASVEQASESPLAANASWSAARARGERAVVLAAACQAVGLPCDLALARPLSEVSEPGAPDPEAFVYPLVRARLPGETLWLDPSNAFMPAGLLPPLLQGVPALALSGPDPVTATPRLPLDAQGLRAATIRATLEPGGGFVVTGRESLTGVYAASWRAALAELTPEARQRLLGAIVLQAFPDAHVEALAIDAVADAAAPLTWSYTARVTTEPAGGKARALKLALLPEGLGRGTVLVPTRETPLLVNRASNLALDLTLELPAGWLFLRTPAPRARVDHPRVTLERTTEVSQDTARAATPARLVLHKRFALAPSLVAPADYAAWKDAALDVDRQDYLQIVIAPLPPATP